VLELILGLIGGSAGAYLGTYLREKAKGLATKEDIGEITKRVEDAKKQYTHDLADVTEALKARTGMRMLAGERRLQAHQEAYALWNEMLNTVHTDAVAGVLIKGARWWEHNALYLEAEPREAFRVALRAFGTHADHISMLRGTEGAVAQIQANMEKIRSLGDVIAKACELPRLVEGERIEVPTGNTPFGKPALTQTPPSPSLTKRDD
jgi:hypothetical protein